MGTEKQILSLVILDREYKIKCLDSEKEILEKSARYLDEKMRVMRDESRVIGLERIAVLAALGISYDLLNVNTKRSVAKEDTQQHIELLLGKLDRALSVE